jgi:hypothetical protein
MTETVPKLVVRTYAPARGWWLALGLAVLALFALYVTYEYGRFDAGYDRLAGSQMRAEHEVAVERLEEANRKLRMELASFDTTRVGQARERAELAKSIGELQAQVAKQTQELAFYKGIVVQGANTADVKVQQLRISATDVPRRYRLRLTLVQPARPEGTVSGTVRVQIEGLQGGLATTLDLDAVTAAKERELAYSFRYFENIDPEITLPEGFTPERLTVEVRSSRKSVAPVTQTLIWNVEP